MKLLPVGIQDFNKIVQGGYLYVDKTEHIYRLLNCGAACFLSRPRRFGKSLLISTIEEIFSGNRDLFKGLWIEQSDYEWKQHPVIRIDFSKLNSQSTDSLKRGMSKQLFDVASRYAIELDAKSEIDYQALDIIAGLYERTGERVVVLIDEYDSPIISNINHMEVLRANQELLASFYRTIKASDKYLRFVFLTGVSRFSKVSVFSGLNNLLDISFSPNFATIAGYTQEELEHYFDEHIGSATRELAIGRDALLESIKRWYNGYRFSKKELKIYNPFSILLFCTNLEFQNYWFETGTPTFLLDLARKSNYNIRDIQKVILSSRDFNSYDVEKIPLLPLLFNTGYLTIAEVQQRREQLDFLLDYPNDEVRISFLEQFVDYASADGASARNYVRVLSDCLNNDDLEQFVEVMRSFLAGMPYDLQFPNRKIEAYYQSLIYCIMKLVGFETSAEERTNRGRIDLVVEGTSSLYIVEMKVDKPAAEAIAQIKKRGYCEKYRLANKKLTLVGLSFSSSERNLKEYEVETV